MRQLLPTAVARQPNHRINYLCTVHKRECTRLPPHAKGVEFPPNSPLFQLLSSSNEKRADKPCQTCSNIHSSTKSLYHRYYSIVSSNKIHECRSVRGIKRVQTCSNIRASTFFVKILISTILLSPSSNKTHKGD